MRAHAAWGEDGSVRSGSEPFSVSIRVSRKAAKAAKVSPSFFASFAPLRALLFRQRNGRCTTRSHVGVLTPRFGPTQGERG